MKSLVAIAVLGVLITVVCGCGASSNRRAMEYMPDMARDPAYKAFAPNSATRDGLTLQRPVAGTIARGYSVFHYGPGEDEAARAGRELQNPYLPSSKIMDEGKALYQTYCLICHGEQGKGDGPIAGKIPAPPSYLSERVQAFSQGRIFHVMTMGAGKMPSYATQLSASERWKIVTYVHNGLQNHKEQPPSTSTSGGGQ
jgi:mono/diheme cytochrome c family protein